GGARPDGGRSALPVAGAPHREHGPRGAADPQIRGPGPREVPAQRSSGEPSHRRGRHPPLADARTDSEPTCSGTRGFFPMMTDEMRRALAILDGTDKPGAGVPREPGFHWRQTGHYFVMDGDLAPALSQASACEAAVFGDQRLVFGVAIRLFGVGGSAGPW